MHYRTLREASAPQFRHHKATLTEASTSYPESYVREEAGSQRYNVGTDTPKLCATSSGRVPAFREFDMLRWSRIRASGVSCVHSTLDPGPRQKRALKPGHSREPIIDTRTNSYTATKGNHVAKRRIALV